MFSGYSLLVTSYEIVPFHLIDTNGFHTKAEKENFLLCAQLICRESLKFQIFIVWRITSNKCAKWACRTRRTIIFPHSTNQIIVL